MLLLIQNSPAFRQFPPPLRSKYSPQHPVLNTISLHCSLSARCLVSHPYKKKNIVGIFQTTLNLKPPNCKHTATSTELTTPHATLGSGRCIWEDNSVVKRISNKQRMMD